MIFIVVLAVGGFWWRTEPVPPPVELPTNPVPWEQFWRQYLAPTLPVAAAFALPLFPPDGVGAYVRRGFGERQNLGEDWALEPGRQAGAVTVSAVADGVVILADDFGAVWGKVVIMLHRLPDGAPWPAVESMYANLASLRARRGDRLTKGAPVGTLGDGSATATPELHFEIRTELGRLLGPGEGDWAEGWVSPSKFIATRQHAGR
ncbi:MAG: M23 family metallopeptidase [Verrucomicrobiales bacterium]|jgi:murein DD-endopeptidase MepM/ murein hydrolase activator NlpD|nr:M23 family metallopeptidase [Verrucomicrobiales bacterium]